MALSNSTIQRLADALCDDVAAYITEDERFFDLMVELIPDAISALVFFFSSIVSYNLTPEKTLQHTATVPGTSGELICTSSCVIKPQQ